jgi:GT2 family glycosyltransferase
VFFRRASPFAEGFLNGQMVFHTSDSPTVPGNADASVAEGPSQLLSIVVLTYNRRALLCDCLDSLLGQANPGMPIEIIVVDDGSTDDTGDFVRGLQEAYPHIRYCPQRHGGIAAARNCGILNATGSLVSIVADDYLLATDYARTVVSFFREHPFSQVVRFKLAAADDTFLSRVGHAYQEASAKRRLVDGWNFSGFRGMWRLLREEERITTEHGLEAAGAAAFRREVFDRVGLFDESFARAEDSDFTMRLRAAGIPVHYIPFHLVRHRYDSSLRTILRTGYRSGRFRWRYYAKHAGGPVSFPSLLRLGLKMKLSVLYWACWRARQTGSFARFVMYLPFMLLIEAANKAGFMAEACATVKKARSGMAGEGVR